MSDQEKRLRTTVVQIYIAAHDLNYTLEQRYHLIECDILQFAQEMEKEAERMMNTHDDHPYPLSWEEKEKALRELAKELAEENKQLSAHIETLFRHECPTAHSTPELVDWSRVEIDRLRKQLAQEREARLALRRKLIAVKKDHDNLQEALRRLVTQCVGPDSDEVRAARAALQQSEGLRSSAKGAYSP